MKRIQRLVFLLCIGLSTTGFASCSSSENNSENREQEMEKKSLFAAIKSGDLSTVKTLLSNNVNIEERNSQGETPLMYATYLQHNAIALALMEAGADVNAQDKRLNSPFLYAGAEGNLTLVKAALQHNADFKVYNRYGGSALIPAAEKGHLEVVKLLVNTPNYPIDHINNLGWTALMEAIVLSNGGKVHTAIVDELIKGGVNVNIPDAKGVTPLKHAKNRKFTEIIRLLEQAGAR